MSLHDESMNDGWTPDEAERLAALPLERIPPHDLKRRTIEAARSAGHLRSRPTYIRRSVALLVAASAIFVAGTLLGYALARRATPQPKTTAATRSDGLAFTQSFKINSDSGRHVVWY